MTEVSSENNPFGMDWTDEGCDGELVEDGEEPELNQDDFRKRKDELKKADRSSHSESSSDSPRKRHNSTDHRKHHHHHSVSDKKRHKSHSGEEGEDHDRGKRSLRRSDRDKNSSSGRSCSRDRKHSKHNSSRSQKQSRDKTSKEEEHKHNAEESPTATSSKRAEKKKHSVNKEAEDGEILEEGELSDDDDDDTVEPSPICTSSSSREELRAESPLKSSRKEDKKDKSSRDHRERRKDDDKKKHKKYVDVDKVDEGEDYNPAPAWGSGFQGSKKAKTSSQPTSPSVFNKSAKGNHKGRSSPPGLYDSPSYSEDSDSEPMNKPYGALLTEGYVDASVAADEKEGIFKRNVATKKKKRNRDRSGKRKNDYNKSEGPPNKKPAPERPICKFYRDGKCAKGSGCTFNHDVEQNKRMEVCKYHLTVKGCHKEKCLYMHEDFPCKYYHTGAQCFSGERCKFSHNALTEDTRRALEMKVAAEDIIGIEDSDYDYDYDGRSRGYDSRSRPSLLGSPPRAPDLRKIPSLFDIETHPPGKSPQHQRPSGFYSEANHSPNPGSGGSGSGSGNASSGPQLSPNPSNNNNNFNNNNNNVNNNNVNNNNCSMNPAVGPNPNQAGNGLGLVGPGCVPPRPGMNNSVGVGGGAAGLLRTPGNANISAPMIGANNRPPFNGNQRAPNNPVLNMLGAIIRDAAIPRAMMSAMASTMNNMNQLNNGNNDNPINNLAQGFNSMGGMLRMPQGGSQMSGPNNIMMNQMGAPPSAMNNDNMNTGPPNAMGQDNSEGCADQGNSKVPQPEEVLPVKQEEQNMMDVDYRVQGQRFEESCSNYVKQSLEDNSDDRLESVVKQNFDESEDNNRELSELDQIRRRIQEQIDNESEEEENEDEEGKLAVDTEKEGGLSPDRLEACEETKADDDKEPEDSESSDNLMSSIEVPAHLPRKQRELFMRIQHQHLLREKQKEQQEALQVVDQAEKKEDKDDWYSDSEEEEESGDIVMKDHTKIQSNRAISSSSSHSSVAAAPVISPSSVSQLTSVAASLSSIAASVSSVTPLPSSSTSSINIMQMINLIRKQTSSSTTTDSVSMPESKQEDSSVELSSPASPPLVQSAPHPKPLPVDPPVVSATPKKPLPYAIVKLALDIPKIYTVLPVGVNLADSVYRHDPRVKKHIQYMDKHPKSMSPLHKEKEVVRKLSSEEKEKSPKVTDPRLNKRPSGDPRLQVKQGSSPRAEDPRVDPRLKKDSSQQAKAVDPRLAKRAASVNMDPRLNRQLSQETNPMMGGPNLGIGVGGPMGNMSGPMGGNNMGGPVKNQMNGGPMNMGGPVRPFQGSGMMGNAMRMNTMNGNMGQNRMGGPMMGGLQANVMGGPQGNMMGGPQGNMMASLQGNMRGGPQGTMARVLQGSMMGGPQGNMMGGPQGNMMGGPQQGSNMMGGPQGKSMMGGPQGNLMGGLQGNNMMAGPQGNMMGGPQQGNNMMGGPQGKNMMGGPQGKNMMGGPQSNMGCQENENLVGSPNNINLRSGPQFNNMMGNQNNSMMKIQQGNMIRGPQNMIVNNMSGPQGGNMMGGPQGNMVGQLGKAMMGGPQGGSRDNPNGPSDLISARGLASSSNNFESSCVERSNNESSDPRLGSRTNSDPRGMDPRLRIKLGEVKDQNLNVGHSSVGSTSTRDPRANVSGDPRNKRKNEAQPGNSSPSTLKDSYTEQTSASQKTQPLPPLPSLSSSATLPPLPSLSPPQSSSSVTSDTVSPQPPKELASDSSKPVKKFDYRNDPRFKRVKRSAGQRKSSMDYSSPLGQDDSIAKTAGEESGSPQYNGYNRPKPTASANVHRPNAPSPSLPDTLQDFDLPDLPPGSANEPDLKVKDLFKTFDPTASPFC